MIERLKAAGRDTVVYGLVSASAKSFSLLLVPIYTHLLTQAEFGILDAVLVAGVFLNIPMQFELNAALSRYFFDADRERQSRRVATILWTVLLMGFVVALAVILSADLLAGSLLRDPARAPYLRIVALSAWGISLLSISSLILRLERKVKPYAAIQLTTILLGALCSILFVVRLRWGIAGALWGSAAGAWCGALLAIWWARAYWKPVFALPLLRQSLAYSVPTVPGLLAAWARRGGDRYIVLAMIGVQATGLYALGAKLALIPALAIEAFRLGWGPLAMSVIDHDDSRAFYSASLRWFVLIAGGFGFCVVAFSPELLRVLGPPEYAGAVRVVGWLVAAVVASGSSAILMMGAVVKEKTWITSQTNIVGLVAMLSLQWLLIPLLGVEGTAIGVTGGALVASGAQYVWAERIFPVKYRIGRVVAFATVFLAMVPVVSWSATSLSWGSSFALRTLVACVVLLAGGALLLTPGERSAPGRRFRRGRSGGGGDVAGTDPASAVRASPL